MFALLPRTNLPKQVMQFPDFPFSKTIRTFSRHEDVFNYLKDYCEHFDLRKFIKFKTKVKHVAPCLNEDCESNRMLWKLTAVDENNIETTSDFNAVIVCNG